MTALLALLAIAGYQNKDKIAEWLNKARQGGPGAPGSAPAGQTGAGQGGLGGLLEQLGGASAGGVLTGGLGELIDRFQRNGQGETADSWVRTGPNKPVTPTQLENAIGSDVLDTLSRQTGFSTQELLARLSRELPNAVDKYTPQGRLPTEAELARS
jgi:uncharacterized protein YidB (DUF937 family)